MAIRKCCSNHFRRVQVRVNVKKEKQSIVFASGEDISNPPRGSAYKVITGHGMS